MPAPDIVCNFFSSILNCTHDPEGRDKIMELLTLTEYTCIKLCTITARLVQVTRDSFSV